MSFFPTENSSVATGGVSTDEVHRIRTTGGGTLTHIAVGTHGQEHELMIQIVLPHKDLGFRQIGCQAHIARNAMACTEDITSVLTLQDDLSMSLVNDNSA